MQGFVIAAPHSNSGKTVITLGLMRALYNRGYSILPAKCGPDYIDPLYLTKAARRSCYNLDLWAMRPEWLRALIYEETKAEEEYLIVEGLMGLYDSSLNGQGSTADVAAYFHLPVVLVIDCSGQAQSVAALVYGFQNYRKDILLCGVILNKVASQKHEYLLREALKTIPIHIFGVLYKNKNLNIAERYLGLFLPQECENSESFIENIAKTLEECLDVDALLNTLEKTKKLRKKEETDQKFLPPLGQHTAIAFDEAFQFIYSHFLYEWKKQGAELSFFSPLKNEGPSQNADAIFLGGGYPELYAEQLSIQEKFKKIMLLKAQNNTCIYGECGGYMVLGDVIEDEKGAKHKMLGLLPHYTSVKNKKLTLGYRRAKTYKNALWPKTLRGHEFHYSQSFPSKNLDNALPLFSVSDALGNDLGDMGLQKGNVFGSYLHIIDQEKT